MPQQYAVLLGVTPHAAPPPTLSALKVSPPATATGVVPHAAEPAPLLPSGFAPQQYAAPLVVTPHAKPDPALIALKVSPPATATGVVLHAWGCETLKQFWGPVVVPMPSSPAMLSPQQYAAPTVVMPHAKPPPPRPPPTLTVVKASPPATGTGVRLPVCVPVPSCPAPFPPQQ